ncbi:glycosyltransferase family 4 protein [Leptospira sp. 2 VSF19]|uniref:Glycosyltransferase family 4 protein n=1 Tax=Leptospira soteropolitanensis TaxID=2950025 RepID=A0AAW5VMB1_9LEPT|nr:glycosyltransferase family 1 protein [Leptospira soteropolitanensis]MCW7493185.1 glycosyltransferase family 4 protein [Leptospira soteropolitanensis]MCW7500746.1 glycosyltransferase family 4 protein [Leptospira soteropolitanensis]MCW7523035.1 glycosyltransferase family 4 protein [Leptospira soteropolitanensis]MCW7526858.1 glycosyltransferase family 4 protein [Leptospira soteropolitanensis]MCW7530753.1 glycosyltransferase family 4 protein [Leptospira soteropolitanensis]
MKIFFDHQIFSLQTYGGISRYFFELMSHLRKISDVSIRNSILYSRNVYLDQSFPHEEYLNYENWLIPKYFKGKNRLLKLFQILSLAPNHDLEMEKFVFQEFGKGNCDIFHPTYYNPYFLDFAKKYKIPYVITVHDLIHERYPYFFENSAETIREKTETVLNAKRVIAISQSTKNDLISYYNIPENKIDVVYHGRSFKLQGASTDIKKEERYILFVGNRSHYKNFIFFVESILPLLREFHDLKIFAAGGGVFSLEELKLFKKFKIEDQVVHKTFLSDIALAHLYQNATLFVFPSLYEGFGIPLLEAMDAGCPVVCSNTSSFPEIAEKSAYYFDPTNSESIEKAVREVLTKRELQVHLRELGFQNISRFSWDKTAIETYKVYEKGIRY